MSARSKIPLPAWVREYVRDLRDILHIGNWHISITSALCAGDDPDTMALVEPAPDINTALIIFRADIEDNPAWRQAVAHEVLHIAHARIDHLVRENIIKLLPGDAQRLAREAYRQALESFIDALADTVYTLQYGDEPEGSQDDEEIKEEAQEVEAENKRLYRER